MDLMLNILSVAITLPIMIYLVWLVVIALILPFLTIR